MFKLVVLSAVLAIVAAKPGFLHGEVAVAAPAVAYTAPAVAIPAAVSHQSRVDVISKPVALTTYTAHAPVVAAAPLVAAYAAPAVGIEHVGLGYGHGHLGYAGYGYGHGW